MTTQEIHQQILDCQRVQKTHPPTSTEWKLASEKLAPLFVEMERRQNVGDAYAQTARPA